MWDVSLMHFHTHKCTCTCTCIIFYSDQAYHTRILLAALDHSMHIDRPIAGGDQAQYHRVFHKRTKHWDVVPVKEQKAFLYIPELTTKICSYRYGLDQSLRTHLAGERVASTTPVSPRSTKEIAQAKRSRFTSPNSCVN